MQAHEKSFSFIKNECFYEVPFFQRNYVWYYDNWEELIQSLINPSKCSFLGSIILKQKSTGSGETSRFTIIDGQQRLTTLSILLRACYDTLMLKPEIYSDESRARLKATLDSQLFVILDAFEDEKAVKIQHSHIDRPSFEAVINGLYKDAAMLDKIVLKEEKDADPKNLTECQDKILLCYKYFRKYLKEKCEVKEVQNLWNVLTKEDIKFLVNIDLQNDENEQAIFDAVNSSGVRLTCSDTIKNALFQKYIDLLKKSTTAKNAEDAAVKLYKEKWEQVFLASSEDANYWATPHQSGRLYRENIEILLHCVAVIEGFFNPAETKMSDLAQCYKDYINKMNETELKDFIGKISEFANLYKEYIIGTESINFYSFEDYFTRLVHVCDVLEVSTFHPYLLYLLYDNKKSPDEVKFKNRCLEIERYIILHAICNATTKNYNKECIQLLKGESVQTLLTNCSDINNTNFVWGLTHLYSNKLAALLLFWVELRKRFVENVDIKELRYPYTLEHIMPQKWEQYWSVTAIPVIDENGNEVNDEENAKNIRGAAVYSIGNMTLLNSKLNTSLRNYTFNIKKSGDGKKKGMDKLADCIITREVISNNTWSEVEIRQREKQLISDIKSLWDISI